VLGQLSTVGAISIVGAKSIAGAGIWKNFFYINIFLFFFLSFPLTVEAICYLNQPKKNLILYLDTLFNIFKNLNFKISDFLGTVLFCTQEIFQKC
jgi:hypothetical protein